MGAIFTAKNINKSFGTAHVLRDMSFSLYSGEVHGLLGENGAGKSTLMKIIGGDYTKDSGELIFDDKPVHINSPADSLALGIRIIYQEFNLLKDLTVAENIYVGDMPRKANRFIDWKKMFSNAEQLFTDLGMDIDVHKNVSQISVAEQQMVEISKALSKEARILIMDEPTAALSDQETEKFFELVRSLKKKGLAIVFITHRLSEHHALSDRITVLRDGQTVGSLLMKESTDDILVKMMVGRELSNLYPRHRVAPGDIIFEAKDLCVNDRVKDISFNIKKGEIVSFFGLMGAGQEEICEAMIGSIPLKSGTMMLNGKDLEVKNLTVANKKKIGYVSSNRKTEGLIPSQNLRNNITLASLKKLSKFFFVNVKGEKQVTNDWIKRMKIRCKDQNQIIASLSGGNQQKAMIARWITNDSKLLILNTPTRGVDVGAKAEIYTILEELTKQGVAVLVFSLELAEIIGISDRIYVLCEGSIKAEVPYKDANQDILMKHAVSKFVH